MVTLRLCPLELAVRRRWAFPLFHRSTAGHCLTAVLAAPLAPPEAAWVRAGS